MGDMARSLERDPQMESILANRKRELGISYETGKQAAGSGHKLAFAHGIDLGRAGASEFDLSYFPPFQLHGTAMCKKLLRA